jgi:hypothetical protein
METTADAVADAAAAPEDRLSRWRNRRPRTDAPANRGGANGGGAVYGIGMIGAMAYFFQSAESRRDLVLAIPKASVWPALLVYKLLKTYYG